MDCAAIANDLVGLLDDTTDALSAEAVNAHFRECRSCRAFYQSLREQMVLHQWAASDAFEYDDAVLPGDVPDYDAITARVRDADLGTLGRVLFEILKAEFLYDYGDGLEAAEAPIEDPRAERHRGAGIVDELRDWHDADEVEVVDLLDVAHQLDPPTLADDRLDSLIRGMDAVARLSPALDLPARFYQAIAHVKAGREPDARASLVRVAAEGPPALARPARVCLATLPVLLGDRPQESIDALEACLAAHEEDAVAHYNLAKAFYLRDAELGGDARRHLDRARRLDPDFVARQLDRPSERGLRRAAGSLAPD